MSASLPRGLVVTAALSWRLLVIAGAGYLVLHLVAALSTVVVPTALAVLLSALLAPVVGWLVRHRVARGLATAIAILGGLAVLTLLLTFVIGALVSGAGELAGQLADAVGSVETWLVEGPLPLGDDVVSDLSDRLSRWLSEHQARLASWAVTVAGGVGAVLTGAVLTLFVLVFFLRDGERIWRFVLLAVPARYRPRTDDAGRQAFRQLGRYIRATAAVSLIDAVGIGLGLLVLGVPLALPLSMLVFVGGFVPLIGAFLSGAVAVLVALASNGLLTAVLVLGVVLAVQQLEGNVLQPLLMGRMVRLHPLAVALAIAVGVIQAGVIGALLAVPLLTTLRTMVVVLARSAAEPPGPVASGGGTTEGEAP
ncbi:MULTISPECIES: AI-2E family transporter [Actinoalloteichus]|uniref:AI-2E family transporter n=1 Tax=Actinoalloteichus TaxID=65496 RepID=UPI000AC0556E|nr:AI-2E family transporter [Actinoalloteichus caeruleus]